MYNPSYISLFSKVLRETMYQLDKYPQQSTDSREILLNELTNMPENLKCLARSVFDSWSNERGPNCDKLGFILKLAIVIDVNIIQSNIEVNEPSTDETYNWDSAKLITTDLLLALTEKMVITSLRVDLSWAEEVIQKGLTQVVIEFKSYVTNFGLMPVIQNCLVQLNEALNLEEAFNLILWLNRESKSYGIHDTNKLFIGAYDRRWNPTNLNVNRQILINVLTSNMINYVRDRANGSTNSLAIRAERLGEDRWTRLAIRCLNLVGCKINKGLDPRRVIYCILNENTITNNYNFTMAIEYLECHSKVLDETKKFKNDDVINFFKFLDLIQA